MRRILCILVLGTLLFSTAFSESKDSFSAEFSAHAEILNTADSGENAALLKSLSDLLDAVTLDGMLTIAADEQKSFDSDFRISLSTGAALSFRVHGCDSKWIVESPVFSDVMLLFDLDALCEFSIKACNHLGIPLQIPALMIPYTTFSGIDAVRTFLRCLVPAEDGEYLLNEDEMLAACAQLYDIMQSDRAFSYWLMCIGTRSGFDSIILEEAESLCFALPESLVITREGGRITDVRSDDMTYFHAENNNGFLLIPETPVYGFRITAEWNDMPFFLAINVHSDIGSETALSFSAAKDGQLWHIDAEGTSLVTPLHFSLTVADDNTITLLNSSGIPLAALFTEFALKNTVSVPHYAESDLSNTVNVFSLNDATLAALSDRLVFPVLQHLVPFLADIPSSACQTLMDLLTDSGVLSLLLAGSGNLDE